MSKRGRKTVRLAFQLRCGESEAEAADGGSEEIIPTGGLQVRAFFASLLITAKRTITSK